jgi:hypothetical protein
MDLKMKKVLLCVLILMVISGFAAANLIDTYKKGVIRLKEDPNFGKGTDWESLFYDTYKNMVVMEDGGIFVTNPRKSNILKFNSTGQLIATYGRSGSGPGDLTAPGLLSILDGKYVVIAEYALLRRISMFDFFGKCVNVLKTDHSTFYPVALMNNKIAYIYIFFGDKAKTGKIKQTVYIKDIPSGKEFPVFSCELVQKNSVRVGKQLWSTTDNNEFGDLFIDRTLDGNLAVEVSNSPEMRIYSPEGKLLRSFKLQIKPVPVTDEYIKKVKDLHVKSLKEETPPLNPWIIKQFEKLSFDEYFDSFLPLYQEILVDSEGNFLIFKSSECLENCNEVFQVYSPEGKFICETTFEKGKFDFVIDKRVKNIVFTKKAIYGLFQLKGSEDISLRLVKVNL